MYIINNNMVILSSFDFVSVYLTLRSLAVMVFYVKLTNKYLLLPVIISSLVLILVICDIFRVYHNPLIIALALFIMCVSSVFFSILYCKSVKLSEIEIYRIKRKAYLVAAEVLSISYIMAYLLK